MDGVFVAYPFTQHEQHGHRHHRHVMVPGAPFANLVIGHAALALGILKHPFHPVALKLHPRQLFKWRCFEEIAERYFGLRRGVQGLSGQKGKTVCLVGFTIPNINRDEQSAHLQWTTGGIAKFQHWLLEKVHPRYNRFCLEAFGQCGNG